MPHSRRIRVLRSCRKRQKNPRSSTGQQLALGDRRSGLVDAFGASAPQSARRRRNDKVVGPSSSVRLNRSEDSILRRWMAPMRFTEYQSGRWHPVVQEGLSECQVSDGSSVVLATSLLSARWHPGEKGYAASTVPDEVFMVVGVEPGALGGQHGLGNYRPEFGEVKLTSTPRPTTRERKSLTAIGEISVTTTRCGCMYL